MAFKSAVFFDIENLLKGYSFSQQLITNLSLEVILESVKSGNNLEGMAVLKAYANWSDPRLAVMRGEINELGIDPVQVFGFSREQKKNAADIQLAIDAIDLAHIRPAIDTFVIVSGDGGFAALAKKLHEYGKTVIGCAYRNTTNNVFRAVCDGFVWINDPEQDIDYDQRSSIAVRSYASKTNQVSDPRNVRLTQKIKKAHDTNKETVIKKTSEVIEWYASDHSSANDMLRTGIFLSVVQEAVKYAVPFFQQSKIGFPKFVEYIQHVCTGTEFCVARPLGAGAVIAFRGKTRSDWEVLPDIESRETHSIENYRSILEGGIPMFRIPDKSVLVSAAEWLVENGRAKDSFGGMLERLSASLSGSSSEAIKQALLCFASADVFVRTPELVSISEQTLRLRQEYGNSELMVQQVIAGATKKIRDSIGEFRSDILEEIIPSDIID
ncbi:MAG: NYN domain-containing protein [Methylococcaceae bacterium]